MKRIKALSITLALALVFSLLPLTAFAADGSTAVKSDTEVQAVEQYDGAMAEVNEKAMKALEAKPVRAASVITPVNINSSGSEGSTYSITGSTSASYTINMPAAGTLIVPYQSQDYVSLKVNNNYYDYSETTESGGKIYYWYLGKGSATLDIQLYSTSNYAVFAVAYAPATMNITATTSAKSYILGRPNNSSTVSSFKIKTTTSGYLDLMMGDEISNNSVNFKTAGFSDYEYLSQSDSRRYIAVKKGTYTISVKSYTPMYGVKVKFNKVSQGKYGTKKSKAATLKSKKIRKGLIITNAKKAHWYKFKNPKTKVVRIYVKGKLTSGGSYGGIKVTLYDSRGVVGSTILTPSSPSVTIKPYTYGKGSKLIKGTYRIKVESYKKGSGYFTVKWK